MCPVRRRVIYAFGLAAILVTVGSGQAGASPAATQQVGPAVKLVRYRYNGGLVTSASMEPTMDCANRNNAFCAGGVADLLVQDYSGARFVHRGDIIWFREPAAASRYCAGKPGFADKRVIGVGGDRVTVRASGVTLDGRHLNEPYVPTSELGGRLGTWRVPKGSYFVLGDNRAISCDSRYYGSIPASRVMGRIVEIIRDSADGSDPVGPPIVHVAYRYETVTDPGGTMAPTIRCARSADPRDCTAKFDDLALLELSGSRFITRGTIVSFQAPPAAASYCNFDLALGRVIGLPGEHVTERGGIVHINGQLLHEPYITAADRGGSVHGSWYVPRGSVFVLADYRAGPGSCDSHVWGPLPLKLIQGRVTEVFQTK